MKQAPRVALRHLRQTGDAAGGGRCRAGLVRQISWFQALGLGALATNGYIIGQTINANGGWYMS
jgi:hypothetical protein